MEESLNDALLAAGERLAEAMRVGLAGHGLPSDVCVVVDEGRVVIASRSGAVRDAEVGLAGRPPAAVMERIARDAAPEVLATITNKLRDGLA